MERKWYNTELSIVVADIFRDYLREYEIQYEASEAFNLIHFECRMTEAERKAANEWLVANAIDKPND